MYDVDAAAVADAAGGRPAAVHGALDVRDAEQWRAVLGEFCGDGGLDVLVNNAGVLASGAFADMPADAHRRMVDVNVTGVVNGSVEAYPFLRRSGAGPAAQPVLGVLALRAARAGDLRRDEGRRPVAHRGARHRVARHRHPGAQPRAAVRGHRDGVPRRARRGERRAAGCAADAGGRRRRGVAGRARAPAVLRRAAPAGGPADADSWRRRPRSRPTGPTGSWSPASPAEKRPAATGAVGDVLAVSLGGVRQTVSSEHGHLDALADPGQVQVSCPWRRSTAAASAAVAEGSTPRLGGDGRDVYVDPGRERARVRLRLAPRLPPYVRRPRRPA